MNPLNRQFIASAALALLLLVLGCTSHPRRVECDGRLSPINPSASALQTAGTTHAKAALP